METTSKAIIPPQNFAVSRVPQGDRDAQRQRHITRLAEMRDVSWQRWWRLFNDPEVWTDLEKRHEMLVARGKYHDSFAEWSLARNSPDSLFGQAGG